MNEKINKKDEEKNIKNISKNFYKKIEIPNLNEINRENMENYNSENEDEVTIESYKKIYEKIDNIKNIKNEKVKEPVVLEETKKIYTRTNIANNVKPIKKGKVICILGSNGVGKSIFSIMLSKKFFDKNIVIIDFDFFNNSLHTILNVDEYSKKIKEKSKQNNKNILKKINLKSKIDILDFIIKTKYKNIDLISGLNILFDINKKENYEKIEKIIKKLKLNYDLIIIDTSLQTFFDYTKKIMEISDENIMISGANLLEVKKTTNLLRIYNQEWKIDKDKIKLVFNKCTKNSIDNKKLKTIFEGYKILGKIKLSDYYDIVINNSTERINEVEKEVKRIGDEILNEKNKIYKIVKK